jgi:hypothetical protein
MKSTDQDSRSTLPTLAVDWSEITSIIRKRKKTEEWTMNERLSKAEVGAQIKEMTNVIT